MKIKTHFLLSLLAGLAGFHQASAQNTLFTYQGMVTDNGTNFSGTGLFKFALVTSTNTSSQATATAIMANSAPNEFVNSLSLGFGGNGYTSAPTVTFSGGGGAGAAATAKLTGSAVSGFTLVNPGSGYSSAPVVTIDAPPANIVYTGYWNNDGSSGSGEPSSSVSVDVTNGLFTVVLGDTTQPNMTALAAALFTQPNLQLRIWFGDGVNGIKALNPVQNLTPAPYADFANTALNVSGPVSSASISGTYANMVTLNNANNSFNGSFGGNGGNVTNVNAAALNGLKATNFWQLGGNNTAPGQILGSTNSQPVEMRVNGQRAMLLATNPADSPNLIGGAAVNYIDAGVTGGVIAGGGTTNTTDYYQYYVFFNSNSNHLSGNYGFIGAGSGNWGQGDHPAIVGGANNTIGGYSYECLIGGGLSNSIAAGIYYGTEQDVIGGGYDNTLQGDNYDSIIACGQGNTIGTYCWAANISGGYGNNIGSYGSYSALAGGYGNSIGNQYSAIGGGQNNTNNSQWAAIAGGFNNFANADYAAIGGGAYNSASNVCATVPGGSNNIAGGQFSFAAGQQAQALNQGAFVWADSQNAPFKSTANDTFDVRAQGGVNFTNGVGNLAINNDNGFAVGIAATGGPNAGHVRFRNALEIWPNAAATTGGTLDVRNTGGTATISLTGATGAIACTSLTVNGISVSSDRNVKESFTPISAQAMLDKVAALPITEWNYKSDPGDLRHVGPMAQDFHEAFELNGSDDKHISVVDEGGVALAAIQGLNQKLEAETKAKDAEIEALKQSVADLKKMVEALAEKK